MTLKNERKPLEWYSVDRGYFIMISTILVTCWQRTVTIADVGERETLIILRRHPQISLHGRKGKRKRRRINSGSVLEFWWRVDKALRTQLQPELLPYQSRRALLNLMNKEGNYNRRRKAQVTRASHVGSYIFDCQGRLDDKVLISFFFFPSILFPLFLSLSFVVFFIVVFIPMFFPLAHILSFLFLSFCLRLFFFLLLHISLSFIFLSIFPRCTHFFLFISFLYFFFFMLWLFLFFFSLVWF